MTRKIKRMSATYYVSDGAERLRRRMKVKTLASLDRQGLIKTRRRAKRRESFNITLTKKGVKKLRKK